MHHIWKIFSMNQSARDSGFRVTIMGTLERWRFEARRRVTLWAIHSFIHSFIFSAIVYQSVTGRLDRSPDTYFAHLEEKRKRMEINGYFYNWNNGGDWVWVWMECKWGFNVQLFHSLLLWLFTLIKVWLCRDCRLSVGMGYYILHAGFLFLSHTVICQCPIHCELMNISAIVVQHCSIVRGGTIIIFHSKLSMLHFFHSNPLLAD